MIKILSLGVILLFVGLASAPLISEDCEVELIEVRIESDNEECGCEKPIDWGFPVICGILRILAGIVLSISPFPVPLLLHIIMLFALTFDCPDFP